MLKITHLSYRYKGGGIPNPPYCVPYFIVNCTFKVNTDEDPWFRDRVLRDSQWVVSEPVFDTEEDAESFRVGLSEKKFIVKDNFFEYIEKFDTFWFRNYCAASSITRECLKELIFFKEKGRLPSVYRYPDYTIVHQHLKTLWNYYD